MYETTLNAIDTAATLVVASYRIARTVAHWTLLVIGALVITGVIGTIRLLEGRTGFCGPVASVAPATLEIRKAPGVRELRVLAVAAGHSIRVQGRILRRDELLELCGFGAA